MAYKYLIEDMDGVPIGGSIRWGTGNSFVNESIQVPPAGREFPAGEVESYEFVEVSSPGYYTIITPLANLWATTHFRLHAKPSVWLWALGGAAVAIGGYFFLYKNRKTT